MTVAGGEFWGAGQPPQATVVYVGGTWALCLTSETGRVSSRENCPSRFSPPRCKSLVSLALRWYAPTSVRDPALICRGKW